MFKFFKQMINKKRHKKKEKGAIIIEFLVVLPVFMMLIYGMLQILLYGLAHLTLHEAAAEGSRIISMEVRGIEGKFTEIDTVDETIIQNILENKIKTIVEFNRFILLYNNGEGDPIAPVISLEEGPTTCSTKLQTNFSGICAYTITRPVDARDHEQIVVRIKAGFYMFGNFFDSVFPNGIKLEASGVSHKDAANRFLYVN